MPIFILLFYLWFEYNQSMEHIVPCCATLEKHEQLDQEIKSAFLFSFYLLIYFLKAINLSAQIYGFLSELKTNTKDNKIE